VAEIHRTTMVPGKLELLSRWMAEQPWYLGKNGPPALTKAGGFRLDDPMGEVGIEFMFVTDASEKETDIYHVPLSYRGAPLKGAGVGLLGTAEHGVLGRRWIYDGAHEPVVVADCSHSHKVRPSRSTRTSATRRIPRWLVVHRAPSG